MRILLFLNDALQMHEIRFIRAYGESLFMLPVSPTCPPIIVRNISQPYLWLKDLVCCGWLDLSGYPAEYHTDKGNKVEAPNGREREIASHEEELEERSR